ncbi:MAG: hypothetical protein ACXADB_14505, partial [Candidatus Hermodarchaeia archaeon]
LTELNEYYKKSPNLDSPPERKQTKAEYWPVAGFISALKNHYDKIFELYRELPDEDQLDPKESDPDREDPDPDREDYAKFSYCIDKMQEFSKQKPDDSTMRIARHHGHRNSVESIQLTSPRILSEIINHFIRETKDPMEVIYWMEFSEFLAGSIEATIELATGHPIAHTTTEELRNNLIDDLSYSTQDLRNITRTISGCRVIATPRDTWKLRDGTTIAEPVLCMIVRNHLSSTRHYFNGMLGITPLDGGTLPVEIGGHEYFIPINSVQHSTKYERGEFLPVPAKPWESPIVTPY